MILYDDAECFLLDGQIGILLKIETGSLHITGIAVEDRHNLRNYSTLWLRRACNLVISTEDDDAKYRETVN